LEPGTLPPLLASQQKEIKKAEEIKDAQADAKIALLQKEEQDLVKKDLQEFREKHTVDLAAKLEEEKKKKRKDVESSTTDLQEIINQYQGSLASLKGLSDTVANSLQEASSFDSKLGTAQQQMQTLSEKLEGNAKDIEVVRNESAEVKILLSTVNGYKEKVQTYKQSLTAFQAEIKEKIRECEVSEPILNSYEEGIVEKLKRIDAGEDVEAIFLDVKRQLEESTKVKTLTTNSLTTLKGKEAALQKERGVILDLFKKVDEMLEKTKTLSERYGKEKETFLESNLERKQEDLTRKVTDDKSLVDTIRITAETSLKQIDQLLTHVPTILELEKPLSTIETEDGKKLALELTAVLEKVKIQRNNLNEKKSDLTIALQKAITTSKQIQEINSAVKAATSDLETKRDEIVEGLNKVKVFHDDLNGAIDLINKSRDGVLESQKELDDLHDKAKQFRSLIDQAEKVTVLSQPQNKSKTEKNNKLIETYRNVANQANAIVQQGGQHEVVETARQIAVDALNTIQELENENAALQQRGGKRKTRRNKNKQ
jgi:methyl-accepting chemotaxis protein